MKTVKNEASVGKFLDAVGDERKRADSYTLVDLMRGITGEDPAMWGPSIVGFGSYHYRYESGREGDMCLTGFSPRKQALTIYIMSGFSEHRALMDKLGKYKTGKSCLYVKRLEDIDTEVLEQLIRRSIAAVQRQNKE